MGYNAQATGENAVAVGDTSNASSTNAISIGGQSEASGDGAVAIGGDGSDVDSDGAQATATGAIAIGEDAQATSNWAVSMGTLATASGERSIAIGESANASNGIAIAIGQASDATGGGSIAIGGDGPDAGSDGAQVTADEAIAGLAMWRLGPEVKPPALALWLLVLQQLQVGQGPSLLGLMRTLILYQMRYQLDLILWRVEAIAHQLAAVRPQLMPHRQAGVAALRLAVVIVQERSMVQEHWAFDLSQSVQTQKLRTVVPLRSARTPPLPGLLRQLWGLMRLQAVILPSLLDAMGMPLATSLWLWGDRQEQSKTMQSPLAIVPNPLIVTPSLWAGTS